MIKFTQSNSNTLSGVSPFVTAATKAMTSATPLTVSWNCRNFRRLLKTLRPHSTVFTMLLKLSSYRQEFCLFLLFDTIVAFYQGFWVVQRDWLITLKSGISVDVNLFNAAGFHWIVQLYLMSQSLNTKLTSFIVFWIVFWVSQAAIYLTSFSK